MQKPHLQILLVTTLVLLAACQTNTDPPTPTPSTSPTSAPVVQQTAQPEPTPPPTNTPPPPTATPIPKDQLAVLGLVGQPQSLNPITQNNAALREITPLLFDTLLHVDPQTGRLQPGLAERWEYSTNGKQVKFYLPPILFRGSSDQKI